VAGSEFEIPADVVVVAFGFKAPPLPQSDDFAKLETDARGHLKVNADHMTNLPGVFAGGAILRGTAAMVELVLDARKAADAIDHFLSALPAPAAR
jgi:glutamate synthase (NADPH/NADH) small chain